MKNGSLMPRKLTPLLAQSFIVWITAICMLTLPASAQDQRRSTSGDDLESSLKESVIPNVSQPAGVALESTVDPEKYFVGPSDVMSVNIWMSPPLNLMLTVTPEGTLIIPTVGEVRVADLTLAAAKAEIFREARKRYLTAEITATLVKPRPIIVTVTGNVLNPGIYTLTSVDRANKAIEMANTVSRYQTGSDLAAVLPLMSTRNIVLRHKDGSQSRVDNVKYLSTKADRWDPYLREGDVIVVPRRNETKNVFGIYGEVNAPGRYEFVEGDSLHDAIEIGQGFTRLAIRDSVEFTRLSLDGTVLTSRILNVPEILDGHEPDFPLEPGDRVVVKARKELREDYRVSVFGEVLYPGTYPITKNKTRLSEVIQQAGGFTEFAALKSTELIRRSVQPSEVQTERLMSLRGGVSAQDSSDYYIETELRLRKEIVDVDFEKLFVKGDTSQDVILQTEDYIDVPSTKRSIYVFGQIVSPGHVPFVTGENVDYYIAKAGGFTDRARDGDVKVIKSKTKQWLSPGETTIEDGDYIWVPKNPDHSFAYYMTIASQAASVLSVVIGIAVVVAQVTKP